MLRLSIWTATIPVLMWSGGASADPPDEVERGEDHDDDDDDDDDHDDDDDDDDDEDDEEGEDDDEGEGEEAGPCAGGDWGSIGAPREHWVHVSALVGDDAAADGSIDAPYRTVAAAVEAARTLPLGTERVIAAWPGNYDAAVALVSGEGWDDPVVFAGCSAAESVFVAADPDRPILDSAIAARVRLRSLGFVGGTGAITARGGARLDTRDVRVSGSRQVGLAARDVGTRLTVDSTTVSAPAADGCGWGIASWQAETEVRDSGVIAARGAGIFAHGGSLAVRGGYVDATAPDAAGRYGRAVHAQYAEVEVAWLYAARSTDASIFLLDPLGGSVRGVIIDITGAGLVGGAPTGDALVVTGYAGARLALADNLTFDSARAAILLEDAEVAVAGNQSSNAGISLLTGSSGIGQRRLLLAGADAADILWLPPADELMLDRDPMICSF